MAELKPIRSKQDYENALTEVENLWGAKSGTPKGDKFDILATLIDAYEAQHFPIAAPDAIVFEPAGNSNLYATSPTL